MGRKLATKLLAFGIKMTPSAVLVLNITLYAGVKDGNLIQPELFLMPSKISQLDGLIKWFTLKRHAGG